MTPRAVLYARVSTSLQQVEGASLESQEAMARAYCDRHGIALGAVYVDVMSGKTDRRPEFQRLLNDARTRPRPFDLVIFYKVDRFARRARFWWEAFGVLEDAGIDVRSITQEGIANTRSGRVMLHALIMAAEIEGETITDRARDSIGHRAASGTWVPSRPPMGFDYVPKAVLPGGVKVPGRYELNEGEAELVRLCFSKYLELGSARAVCNYMNAEGHRTKKGAIFRAGAMIQLLQNPIYRGDRVFGRRVNVRSGRFKRLVHNPPSKWLVRPGELPAIVDADTFERAQAQMARNRTTRPRTVDGIAKHTWSGLLFCCGCGVPMVLVHDRGMCPSKALPGRPIYPRRYYTCARSNVGGSSACPARARVSLPFLETVVLPRLAGILRDASAIDPAPAGPSRKPRAVPDRSRRIAELEGERDRLNHMYGKGRISQAEYDHKWDALQAALAAQTAPEEQNRPQPLPALPGDLMELWERSTPNVRRQLLAPFVRRIDVERGMLALTLIPSTAPGWPGEPIELAIFRTRWASGK